jgi:diguanylate cyclase (GGDEF)-like protein
MVEHGPYLWIAGIRGIARVPVADLPRAGQAVRRVRGEMLLNERGDPNAGQQGFCCNGAGMSKGFLRDGVLWLPTRDGVVALDTGAIHKNRVPPPVVVERLRTPDGWREVPGRPGAPIALPADARDLGFEFAALSFQDPESVQLRYRLKGYDQAWHTAEGAVRSANYTNLPPGDYIFEVFAANNAGVWNREGAALPFRIRPRFHETWLFRALLAALAALLVFGGYRLQLRRHARQRAELEAEVRARTLELHASSVELQHANARLEEASQTDPLTGLRNRRYLGTQIPVDLAFYNRQLQQGAVGDEVMLFVLVDIDHFKSINDRFGHRAGDMVLQQFAETLCKLVRTGDYVARWGGEEFLLVFRPMPLRHLEIIANRLRVCVAEREFDIGNGQPLRLTCSIGLAQYPLLRSPDAVLGWESMVELADQALYYVKTNGRNGWAAFRATALTDPGTLLADLQRDGPGPLLESGRLQVIGEIVGED